MLKKSKLKPSPCTVIICDTDVKFRTWTGFSSGLYVRKCLMPTLPVGISKSDREHPRIILHKANYFLGNLNAVVQNGHENYEKSKQRYRRKNKREPKELKKLTNEKTSQTCKPERSATS